MKSLLLLITLFTTISCTKEPTGCTLTGTWAMAERVKGKPDILGVEFIFSPNGIMTFGGRTGYRWDLSEDCQTFSYGTEKEAPFKHRVPIISNSGGYMILDMDSLNGGHGLGVWGMITLKRLL